MIGLWTASGQYGWTTKATDKGSVKQDSDQDLINAIKVYAIDREAEGFGEQAFLKAAVFRMAISDSYSLLKML